MLNQPRSAELKRRLLITFLEVTFFYYPSLLTATLQIFACFRIDPANSGYALVGSWHFASLHTHFLLRPDCIACGCLPCSQDILHFLPALLKSSWNTSCASWNFCTKRSKPYSTWRSWHLWLLEKPCLKVQNPTKEPFLSAPLPSLFLLS